jgi:hypothetical protein
VPSLSRYATRSSAGTSGTRSRNPRIASRVGPGRRARALLADPAQAALDSVLNLNEPGDYEAAAARGLTLDEHVVAALTGDQITRDPEAPPVARDTISFLAADAGG